MKPISSIEEGIQLLETFRGRAAGFQLPVSEQLLDPIGLNMAVITDRALARGWQPDGFTQADGYRIFRYKDLA